VSGKFTVSYHTIPYCNVSYHSRCKPTVRTVGGHIQEAGIEERGNSKDVWGGVDRERERVASLIELTM